MEYPDALPPITSHYGTADTDERNPHNYPGPPTIGDDGYPEDLRAGALLSTAYGPVRGYADGPMNERTVTNDLHPQGLMPWIGRTAHTPLTIDPLESKYFKPPKETVLGEDMYGPPMPSPNVFGDKNINGFIRSSIVDPYTKTNSGSGALNDQRIGAPPPGPGHPVNNHGFSNGLKMTLRTGGVHPRQRIWREPPSTRKQLYFRMTNPSHAVGRLDSTGGEMRPELGRLEVPFNANTDEYRRDSQPNAGLAMNMKFVPSKVILKCTSRPDTNRTEVGPPRYFDPSGPVDNVHVQLRGTNRGFQDGAENRANKPSGFLPAGGPQVEYFDTDNARTRRNGDCCETGTLDGTGISRPGGAAAFVSLGQTGDVLRNYETQYATQDGFQVDGSRINGTGLRQAKKIETVYFCAVRPPTANVFNLPQYTTAPKPVDRKLTPLIEQHIDPALIGPLLQNPYARKIASC